jgi:hypothetical protein
VILGQLGMEDDDQLLLDCLSPPLGVNKRKVHNLHQPLTNSALQRHNEHKRPHTASQQEGTPLEPQAQLPPAVQSDSSNGDAATQWYGSDVED